MEEIRINNAFKHIQKIRRDKYRIDDSGQIIEHNPLTDDLHASLKHLSEDLYSKDLHFLFELIQNAEDNNYTPGIKPDLVFLLLKNDPTGNTGTDGCLCVFNNECGFHKNNVESICAVGLSTKTKQAGYIGEKGIGFKSVFLVTEYPHIFSNGYRFRFHEKDSKTNLGFIVPYWVEQPPDIVKQYDKQTSILLPLKNGKWDEINKELSKFSPETILFLQRLQGLTIRIESDDKDLAIVRDDSHAPFIHLLYADEIKEFCVESKTYSCPEDIEEEKRKNINERILTIALPLTDNEEITGQIFAYLPTEIYSGLPFYVNADFILTSSRESLQVKRPWNIWLRNCIAATFLDAFHSILNSSEKCFEAYRFISLDTDLNQQKEFFIPVVKNINLELSNLPVVLTNRLEYKIPQDTRTISLEARALFEMEDVPTYFNSVHLVHQNIEKYRDRLKAIGVKTFDFGDFEKTLSDTDWLLRRDDDWFLNLYALFADNKIKSESIKYLAIIPTACNQAVTPNDGPVYILPEEEVGIDNPIPLKTEGSPKVFFLKKTFCDKLRPSDEIFSWAIKTLNLRTFSATEYIIHTLVPFLKKEVASISVDDLLISTRFILRHFKGLKDDEIKQVEENLPVLLAEGSILLRDAIQKEIVVPRALDPELGWQNVFPSSEDVQHLAVLSDRYLKSGSLKKWSDFFDSIHITDAPDPRKRIVQIGNEETSKYEKSIFQSYDEYSSSYKRINHWEPPNWLRELAAGNSKVNLKKRANALLAWIIKYDPNYFINFFGGAFEFYYRKEKSKRIDSEFKHCILNAKWFPTSKGPKRTCEVFINTPELRELFGNKVPYAHAELTDEINDLLGIHRHATAEDMLRYLENISNSNEHTPDLSVIVKVYGKLNLAFKTNAALKEAFINKKLIYIPGAVPSWRDTSTIVWKDLSEVFGDIFAYLEPVYDTKDLKNFFVVCLGVVESPDEKQFADAWINLSEKGQYSPEEMNSAFELIYPKILSVVNSESDWPYWWRSFLDKVKLLTQDSSFETAEDVYVPDDLEIKRLFEGSIKFAWRPQKRSFSDYMPLYTALGAPVLSESIKISLEDVGDVSAVETARFLTDSTKHLIYYWLWNEYKEQFESLIDSATLRLFLNIEEKECDVLKLKFELSDDPYVDPVIVEDRITFWDIENASLYLSSSADFDDLREEVAETIARVIFGGRNLKDYVPKIYELLCASSAKFKKINLKRNWHLPSEQTALLKVLLERKVSIVDKVNAEETENIPQDDKVDSERDRDTSRETDYNDKPGVQTDTVDLSGSIIGSTIEKKDPDGVTGEQEKSAADKAVPSAHDNSAYSSRADVKSKGNLADHPRRETKETSNENDSTSRGVPAGEDTSKEGHEGQHVSPDEKPHEHKRRVGRIVTYVFPVSEELDDDLPKEPVEREKQLRIGEAGEKRVVMLEGSEGRRPERMPTNNPGYDIESYGINGDVKFIEVKSIDGTWTDIGVGLTSRQFEENQKRGDDYWLYVVENALSENDWKVHKIQNPAKKIGNYRFDSNWRSLVPTDEELSEEKVTIGMKILLDAVEFEVIDIVDYGAIGKHFRIKNKEGKVKLIKDFEGIKTIPLD